MFLLTFLWLVLARLTRFRYNVERGLIALYRITDWLPVSFRHSLSLWVEKHRSRSDETTRPSTFYDLSSKLNFSSTSLRSRLCIKSFLLLLLLFLFSSLFPAHTVSFPSREFERGKWREKGGGGGRGERKGRKAREFIVAAAINRVYGRTNSLPRWKKKRKKRKTRAGNWLPSPASARGTGSYLSFLFFSFHERSDPRNLSNCGRVKGGWKSSGEGILTRKNEGGAICRKLIDYLLCGSKFVVQSWGAAYLKKKKKKEGYNFPIASPPPFSRISIFGDL